MTTETRDFWPNCGYELLDIDADNHLRVSAAFLRQFYRRPELAPIDESCAAERQLHQSLLDNPDRPVSGADIAALSDADARENYQFALAFRDVLLAFATLEDAYLALVSGRVQARIAPVLTDLLVQIMAKHILRPTAEPYLLRAAELLFRRQSVDLGSGLVLTDADWLQRHRRPQQLTPIEQLIQQVGGVVVDSNNDAIECLDDARLDRYWQRSDAHELALKLDFGESGSTALCRVLEFWLQHFHGISSTVTPLREIADEHWRWHIGLDAESNRILNRLYRGETLSEDEQYLLLALFRLDCEDPKSLKPAMAGYPIYLGLAMNSDNEVRLKPQNLLLNLPLLQSV